MNLPSRTDPRLLQLEQAYSQLNYFDQSLWTTHQQLFDITQFRNDGAYVGQTAPDQQAKYRAMFDYVVSIDTEDYLHKLTEDGAFGCLTYDFHHPADPIDAMMCVSRDLLDSIMEIYFVRWALSLEGSDMPRNWLDIGAGYGRLAHRLTSLFDNVLMILTDAVPVSTYLSEFYSTYRGFEDTTLVVPLDEVQHLDPKEEFLGIEIASNIHSWSEITSSAINWWLDRLVEWEVPYLFVVPHDARWVCVEKDGRIGEFRSLILNHGYQLMAERPKYPAGVNGMFPEVSHYMFERH